MANELQNSVSPYAGRWVARVRGRIVAQGGTPEQALHAAQISRHKEKPEIIYMPLPFSYPPLIDKVREVLPAQEIHLVGGAVRDLLLNRVSRDLDFALPANGIALARQVANTLKADPAYLSAGFMVLDGERDTGRVIVTEPDGTRTFLDFATYRGRDLDEDLHARDFTINAIAFDLHTQTLIDPLNGAADLQTKIIRACSGTSLSDDPVRILRAVRQAAAFKFRIELETRKAMRQAASLLPKVSPERQRDELFKMLEGPQPDASMRALEILGVFPYLLPELPALKGVEQSAPHVHDVWEHTLSVLAHLEGILAALAPEYSADKTNDLLTGLLTLRIGRFRAQFARHFAESLNTDRSVRAALFFAALYHDVQKPATKSLDETMRIRFFGHDVKGAEVAAHRGRAFNLSNDEVERVKKVIEHHMRFHFFTSRLEGDNQEPSRKAVYRFFRDAGKAGVDLVLLGLADLRGTQGATLTQETWSAALDVARILLENYWEKPQETIAPPRLLDGNELMSELELEPGRIVGQLLEAIREGQATGKVENRVQALELAREEFQKVGGSMNIVYFDLESQKLFQDVGGRDASKLLLACGVTWSTERSDFAVYWEKDVSQLVAELKSADRVIGFNIISFDYEVLKPYAPGENFRAFRSTDMLQDIYRTLNFRLSLDTIARATLGTTKTADGVKSVEWFRNGQLDMVAEYCKSDVDITRRVYEFGRENGFVHYYSKLGSKLKVAVNWK